MLNQETHETLEAETTISPTRFFVDIGPEAFEVCVSRCGVYDLDGNPLDSGVDGEAFKILIDAGLPKINWLRELRRQMLHICDDFYGPPVSGELARRRRQIVCMHLMQSLNKQGGGDTLFGLQPE